MVKQAHVAIIHRNMVAIQGTTRMVKMMMMVAVASGGEGGGCTKLWTVS